MYAQQQPDATWTLSDLPHRGSLAPTDHGGTPGVRLTAAMTGLCQAVLERAQ